MSAGGDRIAKGLKGEISLEWPSIRSTWFHISIVDKGRWSVNGVL